MLSASNLRRSTDPTINPTQVFEVLNQESIEWVLRPLGQTAQQMYRFCKPAKLTPLTSRYLAVGDEFYGVELLLWFAVPTQELVLRGCGSGKVILTSNLDEVEHEEVYKVLGSLSRELISTKGLPNLAKKRCGRGPRDAND
jgi:hypothetical protein